MISKSPSTARLVISSDPNDLAPGVFLDLEIESISVNNLLKKKLRPLPFEVGCRSRQEGVYFHVETNEVLCAVTGHSSVVSSVHFSLDGTRLVRDKIVMVWDASTGSCLTLASCQGRVVSHLWVPQISSHTFVSNLNPYTGFQYCKHQEQSHLYVCMYVCMYVFLQISVMRFIETKSKLLS